MWTNFPRAIRFLRTRKGWLQADLGMRAGVSRQLISRVERGEIAGMTLGSLDRLASALDASVQLQLRWHGEQLDRLMDAAHAASQQAIAALLATLDWDVRVEVSFNHFGERGRIDLLAWHAGLRILLVIEVKSALGDIQETLGRLDVKTRLGRPIATELEWMDIAAVVPVLVIGDSRLARGTVAGHHTLFARYALRGRQAVAWVRHPCEPIPSGLLWFTNRPDSRHTTTRRRRGVPERSASHLA